MKTNATSIIDRKDLLTLPEATRRLPGRPHRCTLWRWARKGIQTPRGRVYLRLVRLGRTVLLAPEDLQSFTTALSDADRQTFIPDIRTASVPRRSSRAAAAEIEARRLGI